MVTSAGFRIPSTTCHSNSSLNNSNIINSSSSPNPSQCSRCHSKSLLERAATRHQTRGTEEWFEKSSFERKLLMLLLKASATPSYIQTCCPENHASQTPHRKTPCVYGGLVYYDQNNSLSTYTFTNTNVAIIKSAVFVRQVNLKSISVYKKRAFNNQTLL